MLARQEEEEEGEGSQADSVLSRSLSTDSTTTNSQVSLSGIDIFIIFLPLQKGAGEPRRDPIVAYSDYNGGEEVGAGAVADWGARWEEVEPGQHNKFLAGEWEGGYAGTRPELLEPARYFFQRDSAVVGVICIL